MSRVGWAVNIKYGEGLELQFYKVYMAPLVGLAPRASRILGLGDVLVPPPVQRNI